MVLVFSVSILVLMEVSLRHDFQYPRLALISVSILVLMEVSLRPEKPVKGIAGFWMFQSLF